MNTKYLAGFLFILIGLPCFSQTAKEIVAKAEENFRGVKTSQSEMTISIIRPKWSRDMGIKSWNKGEDYSLILVTAPVKEKGNAFLKRNKEVWNWVPSIERSIKMPPSMMMQSWMGTDFTNDDLVRESSNVEDYTHELLGTESIAGQECYKIKMLPKPNAPVVWGKMIVWIEKEHYIQLRAEMYDEDGYLVNVMKSSDIKEMDGKRIATKMELIPQDEKGHKTVMKIHSMKFDEPIDESFFTVQNMKKLR